MSKEKKQVKSLQLSNKAAEQGDANAQFNLALKYYKGEGVSQNHKEAVKWFTKAAKQGNALARFFLGLAYDIGQGIPRNENLAFNWYIKAFEEPAEVDTQLFLNLKNDGVLNSESWEKLKRFKKIARRLAQIPKIYQQFYIDAVSGKGRKNAIQAQCLECVCWQKEEVRRCTDLACPLYMFRPYKQSSEHSENQPTVTPESTNATKGGNYVG